jgi:hypothetical protein
MKMNTNDECKRDREGGEDTPIVIISFGESSGSSVGVVRLPSPLLLYPSPSVPRGTFLFIDICVDI